MVEIQISKNAAGDVVALHCSGHAGFGDEDSLDLVCAAVSALTGALGLGFTRLLDIDHGIEVGDGLFALALPGGGAGRPDYQRAQILLQTTVLALEEMAIHYTGFISVCVGNED